MTRSAPSKNAVVLYGTVGGPFGDEAHFTPQEVEADLASRTGPLTVRLNSGGGVATDGQTIFGMLRDYSADRGKVHVVVDGAAMSAASLIAMAGDRITMRTGSFMLIHDPAQAYIDARGTEADHRRVADHLRVISDGYAAVYAKRARITRAEARAIMQAETLMDPEAAVAAGFATDVEAIPAQVAASFNYQLYAHAPAALRAASRPLGGAKARQAALAMQAGLPRPNSTEAPMADDMTAADESPAEANDTARPVTAYAIRMERERGRAIREVVMLARLPADEARELTNELVDSGASLRAAQTRVATMLADADIAAGQHHNHLPRGNAGVGRSWDAPEAFRARMVAGITAKLDPAGATPMGRDAARLTMADVAMECCKRMGLKPWDASDALRMAGQHVTSDFPSILDGVMQNEVGRRLAQRMPDLLKLSREISRNDYRPGRMVSLSATAMPGEVVEGAEIKYVTASDKGEPLPQVRDFAALFAVTNQALANDATSTMELSNIGNRMAEGAIERLRAVLLEPVLANAGLGQTMADGLPVFHATRGNLAATGAALSVDSLGAAQTRMRRMRGLMGETLNITPSYLLVPPELEVAALQIVASITAGTIGEVNPFTSRLEVVVEPGLTSPTSWYVVASPAYDGLVHAYLDGRSAPTIETKPGWHVLGMEWRLTWAMDARFVDTATWSKNPGPA